MFGVGVGVDDGTWLQGGSLAGAWSSGARATSGLARGIWVFPIV